MAGSAASTLLLAQARSIPIIACAWCAVQVTTNCCNVPLMANLSESIPRNRQGQVASIVGVTMAAAPIVGSLMVHAVYGHRVLMFVLPLSIGLVSIPWLLLVMQDLPAAPIRSPSHTGSKWLQFFWIDLKKWPDFGWALANRFFLYIGYAIFFSYQAYYLLDHLHYRTADVAPLVFVSATITGVLLIALSQPLGWWSDRIRARKPFVIASTLATGAGMVILAFSPTAKLFLLGAALTGVGQGTYVSSSLALASDILPLDLSARGMGMLSSGALLAQALAPVAAPHLLHCGETTPNYSLLFLVAFVSSLIGAGCILPIRSVR
jgi:MFS family permease